MEPWHFMLLAEHLIANCCSPDPHPRGSGAKAAELRTAISRCYYATFLTSRELLNELGYKVTETGACHAIVRRAMIESRDPHLARAASSYATLGEYRRKADYDMEDADGESLEYAQDMLRQCKNAYTQLITALQRIRQDEAHLSVLVSAIDAWVARDGEKQIWKG
ncbi:MAG: hypothetical protein U0791_08735 [Gemmataceae bacterium]